jgi:glucose/arabinose dehydrogenase
MKIRAILALEAVLFAVLIVAALPAEAQRGGRGGPPPEIDLATIDMPAGFQISMYAEGVPSARQMALADDGTVFVGSFGGPGGGGGGDKVFAVRDTNGDNRADEVITVFEGLTMPHGVAFRDGALYVAEQTRITRYNDILANLENSPPDPIVVAELPAEGFNHSWKYIDFGPDGMLYTMLGYPSNVGEEREPWGTIIRVDPNGTNGDFEIYARGVRNSVGMDFDPNDGTLWFTDNGRDNLGNNLPSDELNHATEAGQHFGFPFCHQGDLLDPEQGVGRSCADYRPPVVKMGPHVAAIGMTFYTGDMFPEIYKGSIFVAEHGSWNRPSAPIGYRIAVVHVEDGHSSGQEVFARGFRTGGQTIGRPADLIQLPDGSVLVSDDQQGKIYRITYSQ